MMKCEGNTIAAVLLIVVLPAVLFAQQVTVPRIELMPNEPAPYQMRHWKEVALGYDSVIVDFSAVGEFLPLVWPNTNPVNYPEHNSFGLHTVVGTTLPSSAEAINCLPAVIGGTLAGLDKSNQNGFNWPLMAEEWFNRRPSQNVYKNHPVDDSGDDFWYITMPNIFFYQLAWLYPGTGDFDAQLTTVAGRWRQALISMGGGTTPWQVPDVDHRGWYFQTMTPYDGGVHEPEAAGAIAWLLYNGYVVTDSAHYRIGAEWAMEFLDSWGTNPSYELQLPYGAYMAARMNAELGTRYDVERFVNWCFNMGSLRSWGAIVGNWGGYDVSGLIGEVNDVNDYAFAMNTFEHIGALVPMVRYDDRFARAIGKWVLNAANAARLFYSSSLPPTHQDSYLWAAEYDPQATIAYEALREFQNSVTPFATGDAISGGWGQTNLALYGSSHVGILAGIIDTTNVPMILRLNTLATDYYHAPAYPTYLYFNPHDSVSVVEIDVGNDMHDLYDAAGNTYLATGISGLASFSIQANSAVLVVVVPANGTITYDLDRMLIDGVIADYHSGNPVSNYPPRIKSLSADPAVVLYKASTTLYSTAEDPDGDPISFTWEATDGVLSGSGATVTWTAPAVSGDQEIVCIVDDARGGTDTARVVVTVVSFINNPPVINDLSAIPRKIDLNASSQISCTASDPDSNALAYIWSADAGTISGSGSAIVWTAPSTEGNYIVRITVDDGVGGTASDSIGIVVRDFSQNQTGDMVAFYPFNGNANDESGFSNHGTVHGAVLSPDRNGNPNSAYFFNGSNSNIAVPVSPSLSFQEAVSINFWMEIGAFFAREQYPISHGSWQNRWKVSISNGLLRWTIKTDSGVTDLDSESELLIDSVYNVTVLYSGSDFEVYLNGGLDAFGSWSGAILETPIDLTIGQMLPTDQGYNFDGILDDIRIYNYALSVQQIEDLASWTTEVEEGDGMLPVHLALDQNFPNPFNPQTTIRFALPSSGHEALVRLVVFDVLGREVATLLNTPLGPGTYKVQWSAERFPSGVYYYQLQTPGATIVKKMMLLK